jgi:hypothetical protein
VSGSSAQSARSSSTVRSGVLVLSSPSKHSSRGEGWANATALPKNKMTQAKAPLGATEADVDTNFAFSAEKKVLTMGRNTAGSLECVFINYA